jgi:hypothetical protein
MATSSVYVRPNTSLVPQTVKLSPFDQYSIRVYIPALLFFKFDAKASRDVICSDLQLGLACLVDDMPFLAGNVIVEDEERGSVQLDIPDDAGVLFKVRKMLDVEKGPVLDFEELEKVWFPSSLLDPSLLTPIHFVPGRVAPVLAVQVNFIRGGMILAINAHHSVLDGVAMATIVQRWSKHVAATSEARIVPISECFSAKEVKRSSLFQGTGSRRNLHDFPGFKEARKPSSGMDVLSSRVTKNNTEQLPSLAIAYWYISRDNLQALKEQAKPTNRTGGKITESNIFSAFIGQHYSRARRLEHRDVKTVSLFMPCDARARLDPPLHPEYPGNVVVHSRAEVPIAELYSSEPDALYRIASLINDSIGWYSSDTIWELLSAMEAAPRIGDVERSMDVTCKTDLEITDTSAFGLFATHWGAILSKPYVFRVPGIYALDGQVGILPRLPDGGLEFITYLDVETLAQLKVDVEFTRYVQFRCS